MRRSIDDVQNTDGSELSIIRVFLHIQALCGLSIYVRDLCFVDFLCWKFDSNMFDFSSFYLVFMCAVRENIGCGLRSYECDMTCESIW